MKLGKNDRFMIAIGCSVTIISLMAVNVVLPAGSKINEANTQISTLDAEYQTTVALAQSGLSTTDLENQKKQYKEYKQFFFDVEDSFSIDKVLNELCQKYGLSLTSMQITPAAPVSLETAPTDAISSDTPADDSGIVSSGQILYNTTATVSMAGSYDSIMSFVDALDALGKSVVVTNMAMSNNERAAEDGYSSSATLTVTFYGINAPEYQQPSESDSVSAESEDTEMVNVGVQ